LRKILRISAGVGLVLIGIVGLILPVMPGWVFIIPGLVILAEYSPRIKRLLEWVKAKFEDARTATGKSRSAPVPSATMKDRPESGK
jgi:uncharacterized membrane protein YbaN (DUF454 family)